MVHSQSLRSQKLNRNTVSCVYVILSFLFYFTFYLIASDFGEEFAAWFVYGDPFVVVVRNSHVPILSIVQNSAIQPPLSRESRSLSRLTAIFKDYQFQVNKATASRPLERSQKFIRVWLFVWVS
jgi:hypothetical protein